MLPGSASPDHRKDVIREGEFLSQTENGVRIRIRATPGAAANAVAGLWNSADGEARLSVKVTAPPDKGKANAAVLKFLAKKLGLPKSALSVRAGETSRLKTIHVTGEPAALAAALEKLAGERS